jgi:hypothetical protein
MAPTTERTLKTLGYAWIAGALAGSLLGWLLVPAALSVECLTPVVVAGPFAGLIAGVVFARRRGVTATSL